MGDQLILEKRIYPAIASCVNNRYKIVSGLFAVYAYIASPLNKEVITKSMLPFIAWVFTFFVVHNSINYLINSREQYKREGSEISCSKKLLYFICVEGFFSVAIILLIWLGYFLVLKPNVT